MMTYVTNTVSSRDPPDQKKLFLKILQFGHCVV